MNGKIKDDIMFNINRIKEQVGFHLPASEGQIRICNIKLKQNSLPEIPQAYADVLKACNGFSNEDCCVFGAETAKHNKYKDIAEFNVSYFHKQTSDWLILGENDFFYFIYDATQKKYVLADRDTLEEEISSEDFDVVMEAVLRID